MVGTVNEDFAVESLAGDIFQLGNTSYRILRVEAGRVRVEDAHGQPPTIPFWLGEAPARTDELSHAVSRLRDEVVGRAGRDDGGRQAAFDQLARDIGIAAPAAEQLVDYLAAAHAALGALPTQQTIVLERFFDESGGMQLVIHSPYGSRINRAWGLALRKRFCVKFNFELQAAATEDAIVLSLSTSHSFELGSVARYLHSNTVRPILIQAMLDAPMFAARWRWIAGTSLALPRFRGGKKVPAPLQRMRAEDLMAAVFPDQIACAENLVGEREIPDHPLVAQAVHDCLYEAMDIEGLERLLAGIESGAIEVVARDLTAAVAARARDPDRAAVRVSRRCAARGAPHAGGDGPALARRRQRRRPRPTRRRGDRARARRGVAGSGERRRDARCAARSRLRHRRTRSRGSRVARTGSTRLRASAARRACMPASGADAAASERVGARDVGRRRALAAVRRGVSRTRARAPPIDAPAEFASGARGRATRRCSKSCAPVSKALGPATSAAIAASMQLADRRHRRRAGAGWPPRAWR